MILADAPRATLRRRHAGLLALALLIHPLGAHAAKMPPIRTVAVVSLLGKSVFMSELGFHPMHYTLNTDWNLDSQARDYVVKVLQSRFEVRDDVRSQQILGGVQTRDYHTIWGDIEDRLQAAPQKPQVDAVVVIYPSGVGGDIFGFSVSYSPAFLFHSGSAMVAASYTIGIFDPKTGQRISFATGSLPNGGYIGGYSPPWEICSESMWAESEPQVTQEQRTRMHDELWSLLSRSLARALADVGLITTPEAETVTKDSSVTGDSSCHEAS
jgi:hypothetical protein